VQGLRFPQGPGVRVDSHLYPGQEISLFYDPMIGKIVVHGRDRADAIARMRRALVEMRLVGIRTCAPLLLALLDDERFCRGETDTGFLERYVAEGAWQRLADLNELPAELPAVVAAVLYAHRRQGVGRAVVPRRNGVRGDWVARGRAEGMR
jgi:acetyl/propionyl-CoA carboxylase alpha subunit